MAPHSRGSTALLTVNNAAYTPRSPKPVQTAPRRTPQQNLWHEIRRLMPGRAVLPDSFIYKRVELGCITPLRAHIVTHLRTRCPIANDGRLVAETHRLVYIPASLDGENTSIQRLRAFAAEQGGNYLPLFSYFSGVNAERFERAAIERGLWVLEYTDLAPQSTCFSDGAPAAPGYRTARAIEHIGVMILSALQHGERLFPSSYGRTADLFASGEPVCAGNLHGARPIAPNSALHRARVGRVVVWSPTR